MDMEGWLGYNGMKRKEQEWGEDGRDNWGWGGVRTEMWGYEGGCRWGRRYMQNCRRMAGPLTVMRSIRVGVRVSENVEGWARASGMCEE